MYAILAVSHYSGPATETIVIHSEENLESRLNLLKKAPGVREIVVFKPATIIAPVVTWEHKDVK